LLERGRSVASIEMPKGIMRLVPDVPLGAEMSAAACQAFQPEKISTHSCQAGKPDVPGANMVNLPGRSDRRRRVLKEEVLATSNTNAVSRTAGAGSTNNQPRYSDAAGIENHPPTMSAMHFFAMPIAMASGMQSIAALDVLSPGSLAAWLGAVVMLLACGMCLLTYSIRRHRIDDYRGRYRVWLGAALGCVVVSANSVAGLHQVAADVLGHFSGWTALRGGAVWWLLAAGIPIGWIVFRALLDMRECRVAAALLFFALTSYAASTLAFLGFAPIADPRIATLIVGAPLLLGHWLTLAAIVANARFVVLDAQGLVAAKRRSPAKRSSSTSSAKSPAAKAEATVAKPVSLLSVGGYSRPAPQPAKTPADASRWVDGRRPERENYDDDEDDDSSGDDRKLSKSDRKRLRKLKAQNRAA
jgi:hypothetical protein